MYKVAINREIFCERKKNDNSEIISFCKLVTFGQHACWPRPKQDSTNSVSVGRSSGKLQFPAGQTSSQWYPQRNEIKKLTRKTGYWGKLHTKKVYRKIAVQRINTTNIRKMSDKFHWTNYIKFPALHLPYNRTLNNQIWCFGSIIYQANYDK